MEDLPSLEDFILPLLYPNTPCKCVDSPESAEIWPYNAFTTAQPDHINPENKFRPLARQIASRASAHCYISPLFGLQKALILGEMLINTALQLLQIYI